MKTSLMAAVGLFCLVAGSAGRADQNFHTQRLDLMDASAVDEHSRLLAGQVVDIHTEGPPVEAIEKYLVNGARPNASYQVVLVLDGGSFLGGDNCLGINQLGLATAVLETNDRGQGTAGAVFPKGDFIHTFGLRWHLLDTDDVLIVPVSEDVQVAIYDPARIAYETVCIDGSNDP